MMIRLIISVSVYFIAYGSSLANPLASLLSPENLALAVVSEGVEITTGDDGQSISIKFPASDQNVSIKIPLPNGPQDWNKIGALSFHSKSNTTIRYYFTIWNTDQKRFTYSVHPYLHVPVRIAIAGAYWRNIYMNNTQFKGHWLSNWSNHIRLDEVAMIEIAMRPNQPVTLELGHFTIHDTTISDDILGTGPYVDEFGQWKTLQWPEKVNSKEDLLEVWAQEDQQLNTSTASGFSQYGGWKEKQMAGTGFFRTAKINDRWWFVDPEGYLFFSAGMDCVRYRSPTRVEAREMMFESIPSSHGTGTDFYLANAELRYGDQAYFDAATNNNTQRLRHWHFARNWAKKQNKRLRSWGFNTVGNWSNQSLWLNPEMPFVVNLSFNRSGKNWHRFPDVFSDDFIKQVEAEAQQQCARYTDEKLLIGYFTGNEERWPNRYFIDLILNDPEPSATQNYVTKYFHQNGDTQKTRQTLTELLARKYFQTICDAIRKVDPNHLILGIRWAGGHAPEAVLKANDVFDVFSLNLYSFQPRPDLIKRLHNLTGLPIIIGEFHFGAAGRGYAPSLVQVKNQKERGTAYQYYVEQAAAMPMIIGTHYFQYVDQPVTGRFDGENYLFGFVNQQDIPYPIMIEKAQETHQRMYSIHEGTTTPTTVRAKVR
ncbi:MAG: hypothetical protein HRU40_08285 [Saprospiraceae bacterium]|nr:hypothetical protein [Saprospiraceae bacterium]